MIVGSGTGSLKVVYKCKILLPQSTSNFSSKFYILFGSQLRLKVPIYLLNGASVSIKLRFMSYNSGTFCYIAISKAPIILI